MFVDLKVNEEAVAHHLVANIDLPAEAGADVRAASSVRDLIDALSALPEPTAKSAEMLTWMTGWRDQRLNLHLIDEYLSPGLPKFVYFDEYSTMPGKVSIPRLIEERDSGVVDRGAPCRAARSRTRSARRFQ